MSDAEGEMKSVIDRLKKSREEISKWTPGMDAAFNGRMARGLLLGLVDAILPEAEAEAARENMSVEAGQAAKVEAEKLAAHNRGANGAGVVIETKEPMHVDADTKVRVMAPGEKHPGLAQNVGKPDVTIDEVKVSSVPDDKVKIIDDGKRNGNGEKGSVPLPPTIHAGPSSEVSTAKVEISGPPNESRKERKERERAERAARGEKPTEGEVE